MTIKPDNVLLTESKEKETIGVVAQNAIHDVVAKPEEPALKVESPKKEIDMKDTQVEGANSFEYLKLKLYSDEWPEAAEPIVICNPNDENEKFERAESFIEFVIEESLNGKKFLDFGCGEGHIAVKAKEYKTKLSMGYDIKKAGLLEWNDECLTNNYSVILKNAPYDIIFLNDVIDHSENSAEMLKEVKKLCDKNTTVYARCHPWTSRHGAHLHNKLNKAYIHLVFNTEELEKLGCSIDNYVSRVVRPLAHYEILFKNAGLQLASRSIDTYPAEDFFFNDKTVRNRLEIALNIDDPRFQMEQGFVNYKLKI